MRWNVLAQFDNKKPGKSNDVVEILLKKRGITSKTEREKFLNPPPILNLLKNFPDSFKKSTKNAAEIIKTAVKNNVPIVIHGDYDADGICATAILHKTIKDELGYKNCHAFIPNRFDHGYGLTKKSIDSISKKAKGGLLVTVDTGITSVDEISYAKEKGFKVIITDHHQKPEKLPKAKEIVWSDEVVGSGVAWILSKQLGSKDNQLLGLAALATVTDLQPLLGYNRSIVKEGLEILNDSTPLGIKILHQVAGRKGEITTYDLGWVLGPRLNATGRMGTAEDALVLLLEQDEEDARKYAQKINSLNVDRQDKTMEMYDLASAENESSSGELPKIIVSTHEDYHEGIIGLVAAKLSQTHYRPAIVVSLDDEYGKGSVRSIKGVDIISFLREFEDIFESVGGHPMAAGFTIKKANLDLMQKKIDEFVENYVLDEFLEPVLDVDLGIPLEIVDANFARKLEKMKPFGIGNKNPVFASFGVGVVGIDVVGRNQEHLSLKLLKGGNVYKAIYFGGADKFGDFALGDEIDIAYSAELKKFNGREYVDLIVKDLKV